MLSLSLISAPYRILMHGSFFRIFWFFRFDLKNAHLEARFQKKVCAISFIYITLLFSHCFHINPDCLHLTLEPILYYFFIQVSLAFRYLRSKFTLKLLSHASVFHLKCLFFGSFKSLLLPSGGFLMKQKKSTWLVLFSSLLSPKWVEDIQKGAVTFSASS